MSSKKKIDKVVEQYIENLSVKEKIAYKIAKEDLQSSFDMTKSIGFLSWKKKNKV